MIKVKQKGDFKRTEKFLKKNKDLDIEDTLIRYGELGVELLREATPVDTGKTADSWYYTIFKDRFKSKIVFRNSNMNDGLCIALLIQYGHGLQNGHFVEGIDYINPALKPVFDALAESVWKEVTR